MKYYIVLTKNDKREEIDYFETLEEAVQALKEYKAVFGSGSRIDILVKYEADYY